MPSVNPAASSMFPGPSVSTVWAAMKPLPDSSLPWNLIGQTPEDLLFGFNNQQKGRVPLSFLHGNREHLGKQVKFDTCREGL